MSRTITNPLLMVANGRRQFIVNSLSFFASALVSKWWNRSGKMPTVFAYPSWYELVELARWCPTVHNLQPHKLKVISPSQAQLFYDPTRLLPIEDPNSIFSTVALGVFIEHLSIAASSSKLRVDVSRVYAPVDCSRNQPVLFADLTLKSLDDEEPLSPDLITKRKTSRLHYNGSPVRSGALDKLKAQSEKFNHDFSYSSDKDLIESIIALNQQTLFEDISVPDTRNELDHLFRYSEKEAREKKDGLWAKCMGFPGNLVRSVFRHNEKWEHGLRKTILSDYYKKSFNGTATICWIGGPFDNTQHWISAGRLLARNWLHLTAENAFIHPFGSLITNSHAYSQINRILTAPKNGKKIWMLFRAGYSKEPVRSFRLNTNQIVFS